MTTINRDRADLDRDWLDFWKDHLEIMIRRVDQPTTNLGSLANDFLEYAGYLTHFRPCTTDLSNALFSAAQAIRHHFILSAQDADAGVEEVVVPYGGLNTELPENTLRATTGPTDYSDAGTWLDGFCLGLALRERSVIDSLLRYPTDRLRLGKGVSAPEYVYHLVDMYKALGRNDDKVVPIIQAGLAVCDPDNMPEKFAELRPFAIMAENEMCIAASIYAENKENLEIWLERALRHYRNYYLTDNDGLSNRRPDAFLYIRLLGLLALAHDNGQRWNVKSDYVPQCIIEDRYHS